MKIESSLRDPDVLNHAQYDGRKPGGHYESFYQRANHPTRPLAFWIRYTVFVPGGADPKTQSVNCGSCSSTVNRATTP